MHKVTHLLKRAIDGLRQRPWLHALSMATLAAAFLSFAATLTAAVNLDGLLARWIGAAELTVYIKDGTSVDETARLTQALGALDGVSGTEIVSPKTARDRFAADMGAYGDMARTLPESAFPASIDVRLDSRRARDQAVRHALAGRIGRLAVVDEVEVYDDWFGRLSALSLVGRLAAWGLGLLALLVAVLVVAATVRAGVFARRREIEVLKLSGATDRYVRLPFLLEGGLEATAAMALALLALDLIMGRVQDLAGDLVPLLGLFGFAKLGPTIVLALIAGSLLAGLGGAHLTLRRLKEI
ncbi:MAG: permease-like cell division protein FtsX [Deltaproteobacteria bacterium]|nr:permease-like cell division protein FtsX [Deltaproteobacteria bacterium]